MTPAAPKPALPKKKPSGPGTAVIKAVIARDKGECVISGPHCTKFATEADHRAGRGAGGSRVLNDPRCLIAACGWCNRSFKENATGYVLAALIARGIRVPKAATNEETALRCIRTPVIYPDGSKWWLTLGQPGRAATSEDVMF